MNLLLCVYSVAKSQSLLLGVAEMLAMEMKATGMYLSRGLSFKQTQVRKLLFHNFSLDSVKLFDFVPGITFFFLIVVY